MAEVYNIICFGLMPWNKMWKRNQSMMAEISKCDFVRQVFFVNPIISLRRYFAPAQEIFSVSIGTSYHLFPWNVSEAITVYQPITFLPLKNSFRFLRKIEESVAFRVIQQLNGGRPYLLFMNCPNITSHSLLERILAGAKLSIFDFSDDFPELGNDQRTKDVFHLNSIKYAKAANLVLAVNSHVRNKYSHLNSNIHVVRNATNYNNFNRESFQTIDALEQIKRKGRPIIGYSGIANMGRLDGGVLDFLLAQRTDWQFVFIGPAHTNFVERYSMFHNVHILAPVEYQALPCYLQYFDVGIVPFQVNENTKGNDLLKLHDFLAMGKAVVSTNIGGAVDLKEAILIARDPQDFLRNIEELLAKPRNEVIVAERKRVALKNSWGSRITEVEALVKSSLEKTSG